MKTKRDTSFDTLAFTPAVKEKIAKRMKNMSLKEQKDFLREVREGKIKIDLNEK